MKRLLLLFGIVFLFACKEQNIKPQKKTEQFKLYTHTAKKIVETALSDKWGYERLKQLCSIGPRFSGSGNYEAAAAWAKLTFENIGADSVWLQPCMVSNWKRGNIEKAMLIDEHGFPIKYLAITALGGSIGTPPNGINAEIVEFSSFDDLRARPLDAKGKIVFFNYKFDNSLLNTFRGYGDAVRYRVNGAVEASKAGALAVLIRSVTSADDNAPHTGGMHYDADVPKIPAAALGVKDAEFLSERIKKHPKLNLTLELNCKTLPDTENWNIIAEIRGSEYPEEIIVVGGHFDSWDVGCGAHDDGAPSIQTMEVLDIFKRLNIKPKRTIRCVLFANEENGLKGGIKYGASIDTVLENHIAAIESDRGAFTPRGFNVTTDSTTLEKIQAWLPILNNSLIEWIRPGGSGGDVAQIKGTKALFGYVPDTQRYMDLHHSANDVFEAVHPREMELGAASIAILTFLISEEGL